jgi:hypothetical protein
MLSGELQAYEENLETYWAVQNRKGWIKYPKQPPAEWLFHKQQFEAKVRVI